MSTDNTSTGSTPSPNAPAPVAGSAVDIDTSAVPNQIAGQIAAGLSMAQTLAPLLPANVQTAIAIATAANTMVNAWAQSGQSGDVTDAQLQALFDQYAVNKADDLQAQADAALKNPTP